MIYDYIGHRFLYFDPQGALAWESLIKLGYDQDRWLAGVDTCAAQWLDPKKSSDGQDRGPLAQALGLDRRGREKGLELISLGPGEGEKEIAILRRVLRLEQESGQQLKSLSYAPIDVSIRCYWRPHVQRAISSARGAARRKRCCHSAPTSRKARWPS